MASEEQSHHASRRSALETSALVESDAALARRLAEELQMDEPPPPNYPAGSPFDGPPPVDFPGFAPPPAPPPTSAYAAASHPAATPPPAYDSVAPGGHAGATAGVSEAAVLRMAEMGFPRERARAALAANGNDEAAALNDLISS